MFIESYVDSPHQFEGNPCLDVDDEEENPRLNVEIKWKCVKGKLSSPFKRQRVERNFTAEQSIGEDGVWEWI